MSIPFIHQTDIFHPHGDPDDHYDLATVYALAKAGKLSLSGIIMDYPPPHRAGDPAFLAAAQLSFVSGVTGTPMVIGSAQPMRFRTDTLDDVDAVNLGAVNWLLKTLAESPEPVIINIVGSSTDVGAAARREPELFARKCRAIYLNAGSAFPGKEGMLEYNVQLNPASYAAIFDIPCPIYWCPCWHKTEMREVGPHGTWYSFPQKEILPRLSSPMQNYFLYMLSKSAEPKYLRYMLGQVDGALLAEFGEKVRHMWSTASILHAAGMTVTVEGKLLPVEQAQNPVFDFLPIDITCADTGETTWQQTAQSSNRYIFHLPEPEVYPAAMTAALGDLLSCL